MIQPLFFINLYYHLLNVAFSLPSLDGSVIQLHTRFSKSNLNSLPIVWYSAEPRPFHFPLSTRIYCNMPPLASPHILLSFLLVISHFSSLLLLLLLRTFLKTGSCLFGQVTSSKFSRFSKYYHLASKKWKWKFDFPFYNELIFSSLLTAPLRDKLSSEILEPFIDFVDIMELVNHVEDLDLKDLVDRMNHMDLVEAISIGIDLQIQNSSILFLFF